MRYNFVILLILSPLINGYWIDHSWNFPENVIEQKDSPIQTSPPLKFRPLNYRKIGDSYLKMVQRIFGKLRTEKKEQNSPLQTIMLQTSKFRRINHSKAAKADSYLKMVQRIFENLRTEKVEYSDNNSLIRVF